MNTPPAKCGGVFFIEESINRTSESYLIREFDELLR